MEKIFQASAGLFGKKALYEKALLKKCLYEKARVKTMKLEVNKTNLTIMGIPFDNKMDFRSVWHALSTNMFEGWEPNENDVLRLKKKAEALRAEAWAGSKPRPSARRMGLKAHATFLVLKLLYS